MNDKFDNYRKIYKSFVYEKYVVVENVDFYEIEYFYTVENLDNFNHKLKIPKNIVKRDVINSKFFENLVFHIGLIESISYFKCVCSKNYVVKCGYLSFEQQNWFKKLFFNGLGEFLYRNNIEISVENFFDFIIDGNFEQVERTSFESSGNLICVGGGKDSCVSLDLLKNDNNSVFLMNAKTPMLECAKIAGIDDDNIYCIDRIIDREKIIKLNNVGFLNGHIPISSVIAFISYLVCYLSGKKYIVLSNESSANESYVKDKNINHQYSKSFEFEMDFYNYTNTYFSSDIKYFSLLRPLTELQIAMIFSRLDKYHGVFKSCNLGSKGSSWEWCLECSKCLFAYLILSPFLNEDQLIEIFGENLLNKKSLLNDFIGLIGDSVSKPFECVGTIEEVNYSVVKTIKKYIEKNKDLPYLLKYYYDNKSLEFVDIDLLKRYNSDNNLDEYFDELVKEAIGNE